MTANKLAQLLRLHMVERSDIEKHTAEAFSDETIIDFFNTCACCGRKFIPEDDLPYYIETCNSVQHFLDTCQRVKYLNNIESLN